MLKRSITYTNPFTAQEVTEEHYFHISKADLVEMEMEEHNVTYRDTEGNELTGMHAKLQRIIDSEDGKAIMFEFKDVIRRSYGKKEGDRFLKSKDIWDDFASSEAFSQLLFELCTQADSAAEFMNGVVPGNLDKLAVDVRKQAEEAQITQKVVADQSALDPTGLTTPTPEVPREPGTGTWTPNSDRLKEIMEATSENSVMLTRAEMIEMDDDKLKTGLAEGRYKLS